MVRIGLLIVLLTGILVKLDSQTTDPDTEYYISREMALKGKFLESQSILKQLLKQYPNYIDAEILLARTYSWQQNYDTARILLNKILIKSPDNSEALSVLADIEYWNHNYTQALTYIDNALKVNANNAEYLLQKVNILLALNNETESYKTLITILKMNPYNYRANLLLKNYNTSKTNQINLEYDFLTYWNPVKYYSSVTSIQYQKKGNWGSWILKGNLGKVTYNNIESFNKKQWQFETDIYPKLKNNSYLYLNYGYSWSDFFPTHRFGAEYFKGWDSGIELSAGFRFLNFKNSTNNRTLILTGSTTYYNDKNVFTFRPYIGFNKNVSVSIYGNYKHNLNPVNSFYGAAIVYGYSPDQAITQYNTIYQINNLKYRIRFDYQFMPFENWILRFMVGNNLERYNNSSFRYGIDGNIYLSWLF